MPRFVDSPASGSPTISVIVVATLLLSIASGLTWTPLFRTGKTRIPLFECGRKPRLGVSSDGYAFYRALPLLPCLHRFLLFRIRRPRTKWNTAESTEFARSQ